MWLVADRSHRVRADIELLEAYPFLPKRITYYHNAGQFPPPFAGAWKAAVLQVSATTNVGRTTVPLVFTYDQYRPKADARQPDDLESHLQVTVAVTSMSLLPTLATTPPQVDGVTLVGERRLGVNAVVYASSNAVLPRVPERAALLRARVITRASITTSDATKGRRRVAAIVVLLISVGALALIVSRKHKRSA
jgi:hypothetical protein